MAHRSRKARGFSPLRRFVSLLTSLAVLVGLIVGLYCIVRGMRADELPQASLGPAIETRQAGGMVEIPAGEFLMGSDFAAALDARPAHRVELPAFWVDRHEVTNAQFGRFIDATGYETTARQRGDSRVFLPGKGWTIVAGADWQHPEGIDSSLAGREGHPVVHVSWYDAAAYADWAGKRLPTEAEWEAMARGGLYDAAYPWGREEIPGGVYQANYWQGWFPDEDRGVDGFRNLAATGSFPPNRYGLHDVAGNVWEWCSDWYHADFYAQSTANDPSGPKGGREKVLRGGCWLSAENSGDQIRVYHRYRTLPTTTTNHVGFRCVADSPPETE